MTSPRADTPGDLCSLASGSVGGVTLPAGRLVVPAADPTPRSARPPSLEPLLWVSDEPVPDPKVIIDQLVRAFPATGLWPLMLQSLEGADERPWLAGELSPGRSSDPAAHDVLEVLSGWWERGFPEPEVGGEDLELALEEHAPYGRQFPGLAPASVAVRPDVIAGVAGEYPGRLGLVPVGRPADALAAVGWRGAVNLYQDLGPLTAVLRSWEDRFGAVVVAAGFASLVLAVDRPVANLEESLLVAAEHFAACPDLGQGGTVQEQAEDVLDGTTWYLWWD